MMLHRQGPWQLLARARRFGDDRWMRRRRRRSWLGVAVLGLGLITAIPVRAAGAPGNKPAAAAKDVDEARRLDEEAGRLYAQGKYDEALLLTERALSIQEKALGAGHPAVAASVHHLARLYHEKGDYARAEA